MPPEQVEGNITYHLERFFTLASGIDHIESRSLSGVSIIRVYFQPDTNADTDAAMIAQSGCVGHEGSSARYLSPGCAEVGRFEPAGLPGHHERRRNE